MTAAYGPRLVELERCAYLRPTVIHCESPQAAIASKEYMFPFATVVECPQEQMIESIGPTLVCTAITDERISSGADRRHAHRPPEHRADPDDQARLAATARREYRRVPVPRPGVSNSQGKLNAPAWARRTPACRHAAGRVTDSCSRCRCFDRSRAIASPTAAHDAIRLSAAHANRLRARQDRVAGRTGGRAGSPPGAGGHRSGHRRGRARRAGHRGPGAGRHRDGSLRRRPRESDHRARRGRAGHRPPLSPEILVGLGGGSSMDCAKGINFRTTGGGRMQDYWGIGKATQADAPIDRRADHCRDRQRDAIVRPDLRRRDARQDGLRRQEGLVPRGDPRSHADRLAAARA